MRRCFATLLAVCLLAATSWASECAKIVAQAESTRVNFLTQNGPRQAPRTVRSASGVRAFLLRDQGVPFSALLGLSPNFHSIAADSPVNAALFFPPTSKSIPVGDIANYSDSAAVVTDGEGRRLVVYYFSPTSNTQLTLMAFAPPARTSQEVRTFEPGVIPRFADGYALIYFLRENRPEELVFENLLGDRAIAFRANFGVIQRVVAHPNRTRALVQAELGVFLVLLDQARVVSLSREVGADASFSPSGEYLIFTRANQVHLFDANTGAAISNASIEAPVLEPRLLNGPRGTLVLTPSNRGITIWKLETSPGDGIKPRLRAVSHLENESGAAIVQVAHNDESVVTAFRSGQVVQWDLTFRPTALLAGRGLPSEGLASQLVEPDSLIVGWDAAGATFWNVPRQGRSEDRGHIDFEVGDWHVRRVVQGKFVNARVTSPK